MYIKSWHWQLLWYNTFIIKHHIHIDTGGLVGRRLQIFNLWMRKTTLRTWRCFKILHIGERYARSHSMSTHNIYNIIVWIYTYIHTDIHTYSIYIYIQTPICLYAHMPTYMSYIFTIMYIYLRIHLHTYAHTHLHTWRYATHIHIYTHTCMIRSILILQEQLTKSYSCWGKSYDT